MALINFRKIDSVDDSKRTRRQTLGRLWQWLQRARLALRLRITPRHHISFWKKGRPGEAYNVGGRDERSNLEVVKAICRVLDEVNQDGGPHDRYIAYVTDRPGHDHRFAIDASKLEAELEWQAEETFVSGISKTVRWYLDNDWWWSSLRNQVYAGERIGLIGDVDSVKKVTGSWSGVTRGN
jgi:hypothetical protein